MTGAGSQATVNISETVKLTENVGLFGGVFAVEQGGSLVGEARMLPFCFRNDAAMPVWPLPLDFMKEMPPTHHVFLVYMQSLGISGSVEIANNVAGVSGGVLFVGEGSSADVQVSGPVLFHSNVAATFGGVLQVRGGLRQVLGFGY